MVTIKSLIASSVMLVASVSAGAIEKRAVGHGTGTYYYQNGNPGACGEYRSDSDYIVALNSAEYDGGANCGKTIWVKNNDNGKVIEAQVADLCPSCGGDGQSGIDLSEAAFSALGQKYRGILPLTYWY